MLARTLTRVYFIAETEGLGVFNALQRKGIPSKLVYFPNENVSCFVPYLALLRNG